MKFTKISIVLLLFCFCSIVFAVTSGDRQALNYIQDANHYVEIANNSTPKQRKLFIRKASVAANFACRLADTPRYKKKFCAVAERLSNLVTFD